MEIWTLWEPVYWLSGGVTAAASVATAAAMPVTVPRVLTTLRDAKLSRQRELAEARADALQEQNDTLDGQAVELTRERETAQQLARELEQANERLRWARMTSCAVHARSARAAAVFIASPSDPGSAPPPGN